MRDMLIFGALLLMVPLALRHLFAAYLAWGWTAFIALDQYLFGFMKDGRFNLLFGILSLAMLLIHWGKIDLTRANNRTSILLFVFLVHGTLSAIFAYPEVSQNWALYDKFLKILLFVLIMPLVVAGRDRIHAMVIIVCLGLGFHGLVEGLKFLLSGGAHNVRGLAKFGDNNHFAVMMIMVIPLLLYLYRQSLHSLIRWAALGAALLTIFAVIGTHSRGGLLSLAAMSLWLILVSRRRALGLTVSVVLAAVIVSVAPDSWTNRMHTIKTAEEDTSFLQRTEAWQVSSAIALKNPVFGGGFHAVQHQAVWDRFRGDKGLLGFAPTIEPPSPRFRAAHSIYFEVMGDLGLAGLALFLLILANALATALKTRRLVSHAHPEQAWITDLSNTLVAVVIAFVVGGGGVSIAYTEAIFVVAMLAQVLYLHALSQNAPGGATPAKSASHLPRGNRPVIPSRLDSAGRSRPRHQERMPAAAGRRPG